MFAKRRRICQGLPIGLAPKALLRAHTHRHARGFTLLELVAVVVIITIFAALAIPSAVAQLRDRRMQEAARRLGMLYREARMRSLGRGSAVLVRFNNGVVSVHEARVGTAINGDSGCANLPVSSCLNTTWGNPSSQREVDGFRAATAGEMKDMSVALTDSSSNAINTLDICFTPMGRAFERRTITDGSAFTALGATYTATISRPGSARSRQVVMMPNGTARLYTR